MKELYHTEESIQKILEVAKEKAVGNNQQDLDRIRAALKRLKFGTIELSTEQGFLKALLSGKEDEVMFGKHAKSALEETEEYKKLHAEVKQLFFFSLDNAVDVLNRWNNLFKSKHKQTLSCHPI